MKSDEIFNVYTRITTAKLAKNLKIANCNTCSIEAVNIPVEDYFTNGNSYTGTNFYYCLYCRELKYLINNKIENFSDQSINDLNLKNLNQFSSLYDDIYLRSIEQHEQALKRLCKDRFTSEALMKHDTPEARETLTAFISEYAALYYRKLNKHKIEIEVCPDCKNKVFDLPLEILITEEQSYTTNNFYCCIICEHIYKGIDVDKIEANSELKPSMEQLLNAQRIADSFNNFSMTAINKILV